MDDFERVDGLASAAAIRAARYVWGDGDLTFHVDRQDAERAALTGFDAATSAAVLGDEDLLRLVSSMWDDNEVIMGEEVPEFVLDRARQELDDAEPERPNADVVRVLRPHALGGDGTRLMVRHDVADTFEELAGDYGVAVGPEAEGAFYYSPECLITAAREKDGGIVFGAESRGAFAAVCEVTARNSDGGDVETLTGAVVPGDVCRLQGDVALTQPPESVGLTVKVPLALGVAATEDSLKASNFVLAAGAQSSEDSDWLGAAHARQQGRLYANEAHTFRMVVWPESDGTLSVHAEQRDSADGKRDIVLSFVGGATISVPADFRRRKADVYGVRPPAPSAMPTAATLM